MAFSSQTQPLRVRIGIMWPRQAADMGRLDVVGVLLQRHGPFLPNLRRDLEGILMPLRLKIGIHSCINDEQAWSAFCSPGLVGARSAGVRASIADAPKLFAIAEKSTFGNFTMSVR
jgi:hypothetical protein